jgi:hypothetical protein
VAEEVAEKKTSKTYALAKTLETNMNNINLNHFDLEFEVDPLFHKMSKTFDEGGAKGMLLNNLTLSNGCSIAFDSSDTVTSNEDATEKDTDSPGEGEDAAGDEQGRDVDIMPLRQKLVGLCSNLDTLRLCPQLQGFYGSISQYTSGNPTEGDNHDDDDDDCNGGGMDFGGDMGGMSDDDMSDSELNMSVSQRCMRQPPSVTINHHFSLFPSSPYCSRLGLFLPRPRVSPFAHHTFSVPILFVLLFLFFLLFATLHLPQRPPVSSLASAVFPIAAIVITTTSIMQSPLSIAAINHHHHHCPRYYCHQGERNE